MLSGQLGSNEEQTPFIHLRHSFLLGFGPEEGDVTKTQTDDGSLHLEWERAADLGQAGATLAVKWTWSSCWSETLCKHFLLALTEELVELSVQGPLI